MGSKHTTYQGCYKLCSFHNLLSLGWQGSNWTVMTVPHHPLMPSQNPPRGACKKTDFQLITMAWSRREDHPFFTFERYCYCYIYIHTLGWWGSEGQKMKVPHHPFKTSQKPTPSRSTMDQCWYGSQMQYWTVEENEMMSPMSGDEPHPNHDYE